MRRKRDRSREPLTALGAHKIPILKNPLHVERAIAKLFEYEKTGLTAEDIYLLKSEVEGLRVRIARFDQWE